MVFVSEDDLPKSSVVAAIIKTERAKVGGSITATILDLEGSICMCPDWKVNRCNWTHTQKNDVCPMMSDGLLDTISTNVAASAIQHRNQVFSVRRERSAGMTHEKTPDSFLWTLPGGFSAPFDDIVKREKWWWWKKRSWRNSAGEISARAGELLHDCQFMKESRKLRLRDSDKFQNWLDDVGMMSKRNAITATLDKWTFNNEMERSWWLKPIFRSDWIGNSNRSLNSNLSPHLCSIATEMNSSFNVTLESRGCIWKSSLYD